MSETSLAATAALLSEVFPGARIGDESYLQWLYVDSPFGPVIETNRADDGGTTAHYAVVPVNLELDGQAVAGALSLNTAVHERARGGGMFVKIASETFDTAAARGIQVIIGVANDNSTPGFVRRLAFTNHGPLPACILMPLPGLGAAGVQSEWADVSTALLDGTEELLATSVGGLSRTWTPSGLRWRLASPGSRYAIHRFPDGMAVSTSAKRFGVPVAVLLATFAARPLTSVERRRLVRAVCRTHRAPAALHVGHNARAGFTGPQLPERFRDSPLNLITRALDGRPVPEPHRFELLDFDAY